jgi:hypothetical protein
MKISAITVFILMTISHSFALELGECVADPGTKRYTDADFSAPYPKQVSFTCKYECQRVSSLDEVIAEKTVTLRSFKDEARVPVCEGVIVKQTSWGYDFDRVEPFFVYSAQMTALNDWARVNEIPVDLASSKHLMNKLKDELKQIGSSYLVAGQNSSVFLEAANILLEIESNLPTNTALIDSYVQKIEKLNKQIPNEFTSEVLVMRVILTSAKWRFRN